MRDLLTVAIVILIIVILADGVRRMRLARRDKIRMSPHIYKSGAREDSAAGDFYTSELPNGGARVVGQRNVTTKAPKMPKFQARDSRKPEQASLNLDTAVPMLMESVVEDVLLKDSAPQNNPAKARSERIDSDYDDSGRIEPRIEPRIESRIEPRIEPTFSAAAPSALDEYEATDTHSAYGDAESSADLYEEETDYDDELDASEDENAADYDDDEYYQDDEDDIYDDEEDAYEDAIPDDDDNSYPEEKIAPSPVSSTTAQIAEEPDEVLIINVMAAKGDNFRGDALLDILLGCGMRYGDMNIFHRYSDKKGEGALLFSLANMVKPGTFDLDAMDEFETPGVSLFMTLPIKADSMQSFELMVDTARTIAEELNGELKDEQRSVMTRQTIEHCRERIRDFERRRLFSRQR